MTHDPDFPVATRRTTRRRFVAEGSASILAATNYSRVLGANERIGVGFIGYGLIGKRHVLDFRDELDVQINGVAEAHRGRLEEARALIGGNCQGHSDFRKLLEQRDVDVVVISTPDHWHALMTMMACAAGKDVYVEKPLTLFVREGRWMIDVARRQRRIVQVGTQQRSGEHYQRARSLIQKGHLGKVHSVRMQVNRNIMPGFGRPTDQDPPKDLDWNAFLGPAPERRYNRNRGIYHFRWFWDYSGGQMTNLGSHSIDIAHWCLLPDGPRSVSSIGGRLSLQDNGETPDTQDALFDFGDWTAIWSHREASAGQPDGSGLVFYGSKGNLAISRNGFVVTADRKITPANAVPQFAGAHPVGGPVRSPETGPTEYWTESLRDSSGDSRGQFKRHVRNFLDCVRIRKEPVSDLESSHRVCSACHLANLSLRLGRQLAWDPAKEDIVGDPEASKALVRPYRTPWDRELKALLG